MSYLKRSQEGTRWKEFGETVVLLVAVIIIFSSLQVGAQEENTGTTSLPTQELISLNLRQMDIQDVLRLIAEKVNLNIIMGKEVIGAVTLRLRNVNLWQALGAILEVNGFAYREEGGIIQVIKLGETIEEEKMLVTEVVGLKYAQAEEVKKASQHLLSPSGTMVVDIRSNALVITDGLGSIEKIAQLVAKLDTGVPVFNLMGILSAPDYSLAMINNIILKVGETIGGFIVSEIREDNVTLRREGQTIILRLREETRALEK